MFEFSKIITKASDPRHEFADAISADRRSAQSWRFRATLDMPFASSDIDAPWWQRPQWASARVFRKATLAGYLQRVASNGHSSHGAP